MVMSRSPDRPGSGELEREYLAAPERVPLPSPRIPAPPVPLVGDGMPVPCVDGTERPYLSFDAAASTGALGQVLAAVEAFVPGTPASTAAPGTSPSGRRRRMRTRAPRRSASPARA